MKHSLSILIPTFNNVCVELVNSLQAQAVVLPGLNYEILVADDGSTQPDTVAANQAINRIEGCRYIVRKENVGRASIRNFLAREAQGEWLLFIDSDMVVRKSDYVASYLQTIEAHSLHARLFYGGYTTSFAQADKHNLRYLFEQRNPQNANCQLRQQSPYADFHTSNFLIARTLMLQFPLDERFKHYGYEDVLFGKTLQENGIEICHIDNPLSFETFESNLAFLNKTEEGLRTLFCFRRELGSYSRLLQVVDNLERLPLVCKLTRNIFPFVSLHIKSRLTGNKPSVFWFNIYKLIYFIHLQA